MYCKDITIHEDAPVVPHARLRMLYSYHKTVSVPKSIAENELFVLSPLPQNKYFESHTFLNDWSGIQSDFIGHVTYSYARKIAPFDFEDIVSKHKDADVIALNPCWMNNQPMIKMANTCHPGFKKIFERLLVLLGYRDLVGHDVTKPFYCNYWIMKRNIFLDFCKVARKAVSLIETDELLKKWMHADAKYIGRVSMTELVGMSGQPYYTFHPFVMERLVCIYCLAENLNVVSIPKDSISYLRKHY